MKTKNIFSGTGTISTIIVFLILVMSAPAVFAGDETPTLTAAKLDASKTTTA